MFGFKWKKKDKKIRHNIGDPYAFYMMYQVLIEHRDKTGEDLLHTLFDKTIKTKKDETEPLS